MICLQFRRELVWPELDQLLLDEEAMAVATPYTAAVLEYRVEFHNQTDTSSPLVRNTSKLNGHAVYDAQHPCRYLMMFHNFAMSVSAYRMPDLSST